MLTNDAKKLLFGLYKEYVSRRSVGSPRCNAKNFRSAQSIQENFFPEWSIADMEYTLRELSRNGYVNNFYADNTIYDCQLCDEAISELENLPKELFLNVSDFISKFIP